MGKSYSVNGYINAVRLRSNRSIIVEGVTDVNALRRIIAERNPPLRFNASIDHVEIVQDDQLTTLGNKQRVLHIEQRAKDLAKTFPRLNDLLATLTDREWDGINFDSYVPSPSWQPPEIRHNNFVTHGHSIENYHFETECATEYLKHAFPHEVTTQLLEALENRMSAILVLSSILSLIINAERSTKRCSNVFDLPHVKFNNNRYHLTPAFEKEYSNRLQLDAAGFSQRVNAAIDNYWDKLHSNVAIKWLPHGHIGDEIFWVCVADVARSVGTNQKVANDIAHGHKRERGLFKNTWLSRANAEKRVPLDELINWLSLPQSTSLYSA